MNACFADVTFGQFANGSVTLTFVSSADGSVSQATGTAIDGNLTIDSNDLPAFVIGVGYNVTANATWTLAGTVRTCVSIRFVLKRGADGSFIDGTNETVTVC